MSDNLLDIDPSVDEIPCLLLPLVDMRLLVPTVTVAEMSPMRPLETVENLPEWIMGFYDWRQIRIPVIGYESINGGPRYPLNPQGRIAVLNNTGVNPKLPFIAIPTQGIPRMARVNEADISENTSDSKRPFDLMQVKVGLEELSIPDISAIENTYLNVVKFD